MSLPRAPPPSIILKTATRGRRAVSSVSEKGCFSCNHDFQFLRVWVSGSDRTGCPLCCDRARTSRGNGTHRNTQTGPTKEIDTVKCRKPSATLLTNIQCHWSNLSTPPAISKFHAKPNWQHFIYTVIWWFKPQIALVIFHQIFYYNFCTCFAGFV